MVDFRLEKNVIFSTQPLLLKIMFLKSLPKFVFKSCQRAVVIFGANLSEAQ